VWFAGPSPRVLSSKLFRDFSFSQTEFFREWAISFLFSPRFSSKFPLQHQYSRDRRYNRHLRARGVCAFEITLYVVIVRDKCPSPSCYFRIEEGSPAFFFFFSFFGNFNSLFCPGITGDPEHSIFGFALIYKCLRPAAGPAGK